MKRIAEFRENTKHFPNLSGLTESIFAFSPFAMQVYDSKGHPLFVNQSFKDLFGAVPPPEFCVLKDQQAIESGVITYIERAFKGEIVQMPSAWYDPKANGQVETPVGNRVLVETTLFPILADTGLVSNVVFVFKDVTAEQKVREENALIQKRLLESNQLIEAFLKNTKAVIFFKDLSGRYVKVNRQWCAIFGLAYKDVIGKSDHELFPKALADVFVSNDRKVMETKLHLETEEEAIHLSGDTHTYFSLKFPLLNDQGHVTGLCGIATDITELKYVQQELSRARRLESLGILVGGIAHDFNNSLSIIQLQAESIMNSNKDAATTSKVESIVNTTTRAGALIKQLLAFGRQQKVHARSLNLKTILEDLRKILEKALGESIALKITYEENLDNIYADPSQIEQILVNLTLNSRDAMPLGGTLTIEVKNTFLTEGIKNRKVGAPAGHYVELLVRDTGHGMSAQVQERIFEPYFTTKPINKGSGLGLSSVIGIVQQNNGEILLESKENHGTCFRIFLPRYDGTATREETEPEFQQKTAAGHEVILLIEDNHELREITATTLALSGYHVLQAHSWVATLEVLKGFTEPIALIISDVILPDRSGPEIVKEILHFPMLKEAKVLFISGYSGNELTKHRIDVEKLSFLEKPFNGKQLMNKVNSILN